MNREEIKEKIFGEKWNSLNQYERDKYPVDIVCKDCNNTFTMSYGKYRRKSDDYHFRCKKCRYSNHSSSLSGIKRTEIQKLNISNGVKKYYDKKKKKLSKPTRQDWYKKFESYFHESYISNDFYIIKNEDESYDYSIHLKSNDKLIMTIYINYDNNQCNDDNFIIDVKHFSKSFGLMIKSLMSDYHDFVNKQFTLCRMSSIPLPYYSMEELLESWVQLKNMKILSKKKDIDVSTNTRVGDKLINHFHHSIYSAKCKDYNLSPSEAWHDDKLLKEIIENRIIYINNLTPYKIFQGFNIAKIAKKVSVFSAGRAKLLISKYLSEYNEIYDPFSGFSGRMLGAVALNKKYIGQDISDIHIRESIQISELIKSVNSIDVSLSVKDIMESKGEYECLFTCSPYADKEQWLNIPVNMKTCDDWIDECINRFKCKKYLFVVDDSEKYKDNIVDEIINKSHMSKNIEKVILLQGG